MSQSQRDGLAPENYVLGRTESEYDRLRIQSQLFEPITERVLKAAGVGPGQTCLDVGCGPGEVMRLLGKLVGPTGHVTGLDVDPAAGKVALDRVRGAGAGAYAFVEGDLGSIAMPPGGPFDVVYARFLLLHVTDPIAALKTMYGWTKPGGVIVIQDVDFESVAVVPPHASWPRYLELLKEIFASIGSTSRFGSTLPLVFKEAGLGVMDGSDIGAVQAPLSELAPIYAAALTNALPVAVKLGLITHQEGQSLVDDLREAAKDEDVYATSPMLVSAWKRKPA